jgi:hypothetical protein
MGVTLRPTARIRQCYNWDKLGLPDDNDERDDMLHNFLAEFKRMLDDADQVINSPICERNL